MQVLPRTREDLVCLLYTPGATHMQSSRTAGTKPRKAQLRGGNTYLGTIQADSIFKSKQQRKASMTRPPMVLASGTLWSASPKVNNLQTPHGFPIWAFRAHILFRHTSQIEPPRYGNGTESKDHRRETERRRAKGKVSKIHYFLLDLGTKHEGNKCKQAHA